MKREILYKKPAQRVAKTDNSCISADQVKAWLLAHPYFKWSSMCKEAGLHPGNFHAHVLRAEQPRIKPDLLPKIAEILSRYGFQK